MQSQWKKIKNPQLFWEDTLESGPDPTALSPATFFLHLNQLHHLSCPWTLLLLPHLLPANLPVTTSFFKCQDLDCIPIPSDLDHFWPWGRANSTSPMEPPQLPMALTLPGAVCNFPPPCPTWKGEMRASPTPIRALEVASGIWDPTCTRMESGTVLLGSRLAPTALWFHQ